MRRGRLALLLALGAAPGCAGTPSPDTGPDAGSGPAVRRLAVGRDTLAYTDEGSGPAVVLLNGGAMGHAQWDLLAPQLRAAGLRVVRVDARGWGDSPLPTEPYSPAADVRRLLDHLGLARAHLVGSSTGGGHALDVALAYPDRVDRLVLVAPAPGGWEWSASFAERGAGFVAALRAGGAEAFAAALLADPHFAPTLGGDAAGLALTRRLLVRSVRVFDIDAALVRALEPPAMRRLGEVRAPTLVVTPALDHPDLHAIGDALVRGIPGARALRLDGAGHMAQLERPDALAAAVLALLR